MDADKGFTFDSFIGQNREIREVLRLARIAGGSSSNVLIEGESGTGKEILAQAIHNGGARQEGPFVAVNCAAIPRQLMESEMFGYEEGAFTGARRGGWPGNVRELENVLERAMNLSQGDLIEVDCLAGTVAGKMAEKVAAAPVPLRQQVVVPIGDIEKMAITRAMEAMRGNIAGTARALNISRNTLYNRMRKYGLN